MTNPYIYDRPLTQRAQFHGRHSEIVRIYSRIAADQPQSVSVVGEPRIGKTSLLNWLYHEDSRAKYIIDDPTKYVYLLLLLKEQPPDLPEAFFAQMSNALQATGHGRMAPNYEGFRRLVEDLMEEGRKLVLFCDDFGLVTQNRAFSLEFFSFMRSIANNHDVAYVTTSSEELQKLCASPDLEESPFFNIFTSVTLRPFNDEDARKVIEEPAGEAEISFAGEVDRMLDLAGGLPYLLQLTASLAFDAQTNGTLRMDHVAEDVFAEARTFLDLLWEEHFSPAQRRVLRLICKGQALEPRNQYAAKELERGGHLRRLEDGYEVRSALLRRFVEESKGEGFWKRLFGA